MFESEEILLDTTVEFSIQVVNKSSTKTLHIGFAQDYQNLENAQ